MKKRNRKLARTTKRLDRKQVIARVAAENALALDLPAALPASLAWAREYLPDYFTDDPAGFHAELMGDLEAAEKRLIARVAPRGHAKSTCASFAYPLWCICEQRRRNIVIITQEASLAKQFVRDIRNELETNELIRARYGDLTVPPAGDDDAKPRARKKTTRTKWSEQLFLTATGIAVQAKGTGASFRGAKVGPQRPDLIICDDIEKDEIVQSADGRRKLEHWLRRVVMPALAPEGQLLVLGSIIHFDCLLANLADRRRFARWDYRVYRALEARPREDGAFERAALWPARWPVERLDEERERVGTLAFEQEYQANPMDDAVRVFQPEWLRRFDPKTLPKRGLISLMAVDPATGSSGGDYFALWVGQYDVEAGVVYTRVLQLERIGIVQQVRRIVAAFKKWKPMKIGIEVVSYQIALKEVLEDVSRAEGLFMPVIGLQTTTNKRVRIEGLAPFVENGVMRFPEELDGEAEAQFLQFPKAKHDDAPDVCAMGLALARSVGAGGKVETARVRGEARGAGW